MNPILLVDDDIAFRSYSAHVLKEKGYSVLQAGNGMEALKYLRENVFELIIVDVFMPEMDGRELIRWLRTKGPEFYIIAISSNENYRVIAECPVADGSMHKLFSPAAILAAVEFVPQVSADLMLAGQAACHAAD